MERIWRGGEGQDDGRKFWRRGWRGKGGYMRGRGGERVGTKEERDNIAERGVTISR